MSLPTGPFAPFDGAFLRAFCELLAVRTGLQVREKDRGAVTRTLTGRSEALGMSEAQYLQKLRMEKTEGAEWTQLIPRLTNGESYFERDKGQFALLRDTILPEIIEQRRGTGEGVLRLWSAGCSTGEEAYSLAMAADAVLPSGWKATILGTDINLESLQKARRGVYGAWSFRGVEERTRDRYFRSVAGGYEVASELRGRVTFGFCNLSADDWPDARRGIADLDLIVCRNVLIYFQRSVVAGVVERFARALREGGFLLTGHAELHDQSVSPLRPRLFPASAAYQKEKSGTITAPRGIVPSPTPIARRPIVTSTLPSPQLRPIELLVTKQNVGSRLPAERGAGAPVSRPTPSLTSASTQGSISTAEGWYAQARSAADGGRHSEAVACCRRAVGADPAHSGAYLLWAHIAEETGEPEEAKELLKKVIYLAPSNARAYVELAAIYEREGNVGRARQMRLSAMKLLQMPERNNTFSSEDERNELLRHVGELLGEGETPNPAGGQR